jgi:hypothetical protein
MMDRATEILERELPPAHPERVAALKADAYLHLIDGAHHAARRVAERAVELGRELWSDEHPFVLTAELIVATAEVRAGEFKEADRRLTRIAKHLERSYGSHPMLAIALSRRAQLELARCKNFGRAEALARAALDMYRHTYPRASDSLTWTLFRVLMDSQRSVDAGELVEQVAAEVSQSMLRSMAAELSRAFIAVGDHRAAVTWIERVRDATEPGEDRDEWSAYLERWTRYIRRFEPGIA